MRATSAALGALLIAGTLRAQTNVPVLTGSEAATRFVYHGEPVHPFCLDFPLERSSRNAPSSLDTCTDTHVAISTDSTGWRRAEYPPASGRGHVSYRVLASAGSRFLVATETWGGGSGEFSNLFWTRLGGRQIAIDGDVAGGDRCAGGLSNYAVEGSVIRFQQSTTATDILRLAGVALADSIRDRLWSGYTACEGEATYRYDLPTGKLVLSALTLNPERAATDSGSAAHAVPETQVCFDILVRQYISSGRQSLTAAALNAFGRRFVTQCDNPSGR